MTKKIKKTVLQSSEDISRTLKNKSSRSGKHLSLYQQLNNLESSRLGLAIPKKNAKRAIDRNRIKRLIRENFRNSNQNESYDIVIKLHTPIGKNTRKKLRESERIAIRQELIKFFDKKL